MVCAREIDAVSLVSDSLWHTWGDISKERSTSNIRALCYGVLCCVVFCCVVLCCAVLCCAVLCSAGRHSRFGTCLHGGSSASSTASPFTPPPQALLKSRTFFWGFGDEKAEGHAALYQTTLCWWKGRGKHKGAWFQWSPLTQTCPDLVLRPEFLTE